LLVLERITRDTEGKPVEMTTHFLRPDVYQLSVALNDVQSLKP
jgi:GntR family transcriptional regulator